MPQTTTKKKKTSNQIYGSNPAKIPKQYEPRNHTTTRQQYRKTTKTVPILRKKRLRATEHQDYTNKQKRTQRVQYQHNHRKQRATILRCKSLEHTAQCEQHMTTINNKIDTEYSWPNLEETTMDI